MVGVALLSGLVTLMAADVTVRGRIVDPEGLALPGVVVSLTPAGGGEGQTAVTDQAGSYLISTPAGRYVLRAELAGFQPAERPVVIAGTDPIVVDLTLALALHEEEVTVRGDAATPVMGDPHPDAPVTVTREVVDNGMLPNSQYDDVLPLLPNVVRGPDGLISVAGARAPQGALVVNGFNVTDPVSGEPGIMLPIEAVDSMEVFSGGYSADLGRATGGVTSVHTRAGAEEFQMSANSFFPRLWFVGGKLQGIESWEPNLGVSGPVVKGRVYFEQALSYRFDRNRFDTLAGTEYQTFDTLLSWSQLDVQVSPAQRLIASVSFDPQTTDHAGITAFTPLASVPQVGRGGWSTALEDRITIGDRSALELRAGMIRTTRSVTPDGSVAYEMGHDLTRGSYFDSQDLRGDRVEAGAVWAWTGPRGHLLKFGTSVGGAGLNGVDESAPVDLLRSDGSVARVVGFMPGQPLSALAYETGVFADDSWTVSPSITIDTGVRYDHTTAAGGRFSPRTAWTIKLPDGRSTISGSAGLFADKLPLDVRTFPSLPGRLIQTFDPFGALSATTFYTNVMAGPLRTPVATRWDIEFDRRFSGGWQARVKYQERHGRDEPVIDPTFLSDSAALLSLTSTGTSEARSIETTIAYRAPHSGNEVYVSYVRSRASGDLNSFDAIEGVFRQPFVQANEVGPLLADVPNRLLAWGMLHLPRRITVAPFVEIRDGFPYSAIDEAWTYVGPRNSCRLPWFGSLDLYVNKIFGLPGRLPDARIGLKLYSLVSINSQRDVQPDMVRSDFGATYNAIPRDFTAVFELLWGHK